MSESVFKIPDGEVECNECLMANDRLLRFVPEFVIGITLPEHGIIHADSLGHWWRRNAGTYSTSSIPTDKEATGHCTSASQAC